MNETRPPQYDHPRPTRLSEAFEKARKLPRNPDRRKRPSPGSVEAVVVAHKRSCTSGKNMTTTGDRLADTQASPPPSPPRPPPPMTTAVAPLCDPNVPAIIGGSPDEQLVCLLVENAHEILASTQRILVWNKIAAKTNGRFETGQKVLEYVTALTHAVKTRRQHLNLTLETTSQLAGYQEIVRLHKPDDSHPVQVDTSATAVGVIDPVADNKLIQLLLDRAKGNGFKKQKTTEFWHKLAIETRPRFANDSELVAYVRWLLMVAVIPSHSQHRKMSSEFQARLAQFQEISQLKISTTDLYRLASSTVATATSATSTTTSSASMATITTPTAIATATATTVTPSPATSPDGASDPAAARTRDDSKRVAQLSTTECDALLVDLVQQKFPFFSMRGAERRTSSWDAIASAMGSKHESFRNGQDVKTQFFHLLAIARDKTHCERNRMSKSLLAKIQEYIAFHDENASSGSIHESPPEEATAVDSDTYELEEEEEYNDVGMEHDPEEEQDDQAADTLAEIEHAPPLDPGFDHGVPTVVHEPTRGDPSTDIDESVEATTEAWDRQRARVVSVFHAHQAPTEDGEDSEGSQHSQDNRTRQEEYTDNAQQNGTRRQEATQVDDFSVSYQASQPPWSTQPPPPLPQTAERPIYTRSLPPSSLIPTKGQEVDALQQEVTTLRSAAVEERARFKAKITSLKEKVGRNEKAATLEKERVEHRAELHAIMEEFKKERDAHRQETVGLMDLVQKERDAHRQETVGLMDLVQKERDERREQFVAMINLVTRSVFGAQQQERSDDQ